MKITPGQEKFEEEVNIESPKPFHLFTCSDAYQHCRCKLLLIVMNLVDYFFLNKFDTN